MDIENKYYNAKAMRDEDETQAIADFLALPELEPEKGDW